MNSLSLSLALPPPPLLRPPHIVYFEFVNVRGLHDFTKTASKEFKKEKEKKRKKEERNKQNKTKQITCRRENPHHRHHHYSNNASSNKQKQQRNSPNLPTPSAQSSPVSTHWFAICCTLLLTAATVLCHKYSSHCVSQMMARLDVFTQGTHYDDKLLREEWASPQGTNKR